MDGKVAHIENRKKRDPQTKRKGGVAYFINPYGKKKRKEKGQVAFKKGSRGKKCELCLPQKAGRAW